VYNKVADSDDVVIEKQGFSIFDTHEPAIAKPRSPFCLHVTQIDSHRNQIFLVGRHQEVCRFVSPGLHHIMSVSSHGGMLHNERHTSTLFGLFLRSSVMILLHWQAFRTAIYWNRHPRAARKWWRCECGTEVWWGYLMRGTPFSQATGVETLLVMMHRRCEFFLTY
jgi:hypothetical protein